jgi:hypothetical protein
MVIVNTRVEEVMVVEDVAVEVLVLVVEEVAEEVSGCWFVVISMSDMMVRNTAIGQIGRLHRKVILVLIPILLPLLLRLRLRLRSILNRSLHLRLLLMHRVRIVVKPRELKQLGSHDRQNLLHK